MSKRVDSNENLSPEDLDAAAIAAADVFAQRGLLLIQQQEHQRQQACHHPTSNMLLPGVPYDPADTTTSSVSYARARSHSFSDDFLSSASSVPAENKDATSLLHEGSIDRSTATSIMSTSNSSSNKKAACSIATRRRKQSRIYDDPSVMNGYNKVPLLEMLKLPRGGISIDTKAVGRIQFGIPPETIKDSMRLGLEVPRVYIVPVDRFCREVGPALGINLAEFEFPAYFNWFVRRKKCTLVVDSEEAERDIRTVFEETLLGPHEYRDMKEPKAWDDEDFDPSFPHEDRPNFFREFQHFRKAEKTEVYDELNVDLLIDYCHFERSENVDETKNERIGVPPIVSPNLFSDVNEEEYLNTLHSSVTDMGHNGSVASRQGIRPFSSAREKPSSFLVPPASSFLVPPTRLGRAITDFVADVRHMGSRLSKDNSVSSSNNNDASILRPTLSHGLRSSSFDANEESVSLELSVASTPSKPPGAAATSSSSTTTTTTPLDCEQTQHWLFSQVKWLGEVACVWPSDATPEQIKCRSVPRVEIFKMPGGSEYIVHDVDANNYIVGKARLKGTVEVPDEIEVEGFLASDVASSTSRMVDDGLRVSGQLNLPLPFFPPSFGVTILGNSHGFDKNGSTSGYVIWINGRGVMVDPPPYSSATLEREGIRAQTIIAIIITHCHADHDAGAFQKVLTGSRVAIITAPSIYKSFIHKYSALSGLSPRFLRHSHRFRPAIIGQPLRFQGATFHFNFSLHTIPCLALRVEWRGRSVVFTGDHLNLPPLIGKLEESGVLSKGRADSLRQLPLQECDVLLHEAGAPPIHTPLSVLQELPEQVRNRLYVVHTSALPEDCGLRVAPVGTAGTIRLDRTESPVSLHQGSAIQKVNKNNHDLAAYGAPAYGRNVISPQSLDDGGNMSLSVLGDCVAINAAVLQSAGLADERIPPIVYQRPTCVSDAWFILNLLSTIPFFSSLSYVNTMEVLEIAGVEVFCAHDIVLSGSQRGKVLCVVWEGACMERGNGDEGQDPSIKRSSAVWYAGDWTGPVALQPDEELCCGARDIVAVSAEGVKVIFLQMVALQKILKRGSPLYRKYLALERSHEATGDFEDDKRQQPLRDFFASDHTLDVLRCNSVFDRLQAVQKRSLESIAEGPRMFEEGETLWRLGDLCDYAFLIVAGTVTFDPISPSKTRTLRHRGSLNHLVELGNGRFIEADKLIQKVTPDSEYARLESILSLRVANQQVDEASNRFANKVLSQLYASRKYTKGLVFGRGCFLSDTSRMVSGEFVHESGDNALNPDVHRHSSTMVVGREGCVAMVFPRSTLVPFLDANPGMLLVLLGTQVLI